MTIQAMKAHIKVLEDQLEQAKQNVDNYDNLLVNELELNIKDLQACIDAGLTAELLGL